MKSLTLVTYRRTEPIDEEHQPLQMQSFQRFPSRKKEKIAISEIFKKNLFFLNSFLKTFCTKILKSNFDIFEMFLKSQTCIGQKGQTAETAYMQGFNYSVQRLGNNAQ